MKLCCRCKEVRPLADFNKSGKRLDGRHPMCKICCKQWRFENRDALLKKKKEYHQIPHIKEYTKQYRAQYYKDNKETMLAQQREYYAVPQNRAKKLLSKTKERALQDGIEFNLELEDIIIPTHCPYLGIELTHHLGKGYLDSNSSIDKINPELGYVKGNVQIISRLANQMKNSANKEQLLIFAHNIIRMYS